MHRDTLKASKNMNTISLHWSNRVGPETCRPCATQTVVALSVTLKRDSNDSEAEEIGSPAWLSSSLTL